STSTSSSCSSEGPSWTPPVWISVRRSVVEGQCGDDEETERLAAKVKQILDSAPPSASATPATPTASCARSSPPP
ncbi:hypothetical protein PENTCL1PPCAC_6755, partial [Pristionchus entomophagus]